MKKQLRRTLLKSLGIGSVWSTPIVSSVILPAHAETSIGVPPPVNEEFGSAGTSQFKVPDGVTQLKITVNGAGGGTANTTNTSSPVVHGGNGEQIVQTVTAVPGDTLSITVGGGGKNGQPNAAEGSHGIDSPGIGGNPGDGQDAIVWGGGGGGYSQVTGVGISIQAGGGGGGFGRSKFANSKSVTEKAGDGGGTNGGAGALPFNDGEDAGNGLGGLGSSTNPTLNDPPLGGEDGSVIISSS